MTRPPAASVSATAGRDALREHDLKVWPPFLDALLDGSKTFEVRRNDRDFHVGDVLLLREWEPTDSGIPRVYEPVGYTGRETRRRVSYVLDRTDCPAQGIAEGFVVLGLAALDGLPDTPTDEGLRRDIEQLADEWEWRSTQMLARERPPSGDLGMYLAGRADDLRATLTAPAARPETDEPLRETAERLYRDAHTDGQSGKFYPGMRIRDFLAALAAAPDENPGACLACGMSWRACVDDAIEIGSDEIDGCCDDCGHVPAATPDRAGTDTAHRDGLRRAVLTEAADAIAAASRERLRSGASNYDFRAGLGEAERICTTLAAEPVPGADEVPSGE